MLLNENDIDSDDQVRTFTSNTSKRPSLSRQNATSGRTQLGRMGTSGTGAFGPGGVQSGRSTAILTGRMTSTSSRQTAGRASSSYRPLTTSLTASQTAFSRSTRPLLKYANDEFLSKLIYEYLYNVQKVTNKCPDYRQCLEYLNIVQQRYRSKTNKHSESWNEKYIKEKLIDITETEQGGSSSISDHVYGNLDTFWLLAFGICYFNLRMNKLAYDYFEAALKSNDRQLDAYLWLVKIHLRQNEPFSVLRVCDDGLRKCKSAILFNWKARVQSLIQDSFAAHSSLRESLKFYPTNIEALANVGYFSFHSDKLEQALKCFERIIQLSLNSQGTSYLSGGSAIGAVATGSSLGLMTSSCELLNNLALCNFYCGNLTKVLPLFQQAFLCSPSKEVTSDIWYNISFLPLNFGCTNLAIACLQLALKNDSQNEQAVNNLGVLKYGWLIDEPINYYNRQELWSMPISGPTAVEKRHNLENLDKHHRRQQVLFDEAETCFSIAKVRKNSVTTNGQSQLEEDITHAQPEMLCNMALVKNRRGQLLACVEYCRRYLEFDSGNRMMKNLLRDIKKLVAHDV